MASETRGEPATGVNFTEYDAEPPITQPALGPLGWLRWAWRQLTSMRSALLLLFLLAIAAVPGSIVPQNREDPGRVSDYLDAHPTLGPWLERLGFFDVYTSVWFSAIYLLLFVSLVGCVIPRARVHLRAIRQAPPRAPRRLERLPEHVSLLAPAGTPAGASTDAALDAALAALRRRRYRVVDNRTAPPAAGASAGRPGGWGERSISAEKGYTAETGNLAFHLALLGVLVSLAWGSLASYSGQAVIVQGSTFVNSVIDYDSFGAGRLVDTGTLPPFSATLKDFVVEFETADQGNQFGAPREFEATFEVVDRPGAAPRTAVVSPNHPLDVQGTRMFLVGNGYAPVLTVRDGAGNVAFRGPVITRPQDGNYKSLAVAKVPNAVPRQIALVGVFLPTYDLQDGIPVSQFPQPLDPRLMVNVLLADPGVDGLDFRSGTPQSVMRLGPGMTMALGDDGQPLKILLAPGTSAPLPDGAGTVSFDGLTRYAAMDIRRDPSKGWALGTALLALVGVTASLFVRRRRVFVRAVDGADGVVVTVAGLTRGDDAALGAEVAAIAAATVPEGGPVADPGGGPATDQSTQQTNGQTRTEEQS
ncbi:MAG: cytochrome c biogenesis protein ResB [Kineosporiaceae bacterium]|nr:cytochrome c biogenesis protein ResB [Kineosporiaceae bacterium]